MIPMKRAGFSLDPRLEMDSHPVLCLGLCELRLMDDRRWPWLILVPQRQGAQEIHDLTPLDQAMLAFETNMVAQALKEITACAKINTGALGNSVRQMHIHVVARSEGDPNWPGPVWGFGSRDPYQPEALYEFAQKVKERICSHG
ncbi:MAG: HIT domain-containing protein [Rhizobiaceae bacterium]|nr:MAG: HIT domain-containing protein [Rhizobiaceae bacterium]